jgi:FkbM family methyltransferase
MNTQEILETLWPLRALLQRLRGRGLIVEASGARFLYASDDLMNLKIAMVGAHEFDTTHVLLNRLLPSDIFVDVGANLGYFSVLAAKRLTEGQVIAVEPSPRSYRLLRTNVELNGLNNVQIVQRILWRESGQPLELHATDPWNSGADSVLGAGATEAAGISMTLDELAADLGLDRMGAIKIDVEGAELDVLLGAVRCFRQFRPRLVILAADNPCESVRREAVNLIAAAGYSEIDPFASKLRAQRDTVARALFFYERTGAGPRGH